MALSIKTEEADRLARVLSQLTGESLTRAVTIALPARRFQYWSERRGGWVRMAGARRVAAGGSSRDLRAFAEVR